MRLTVGILLGAVIGLFASFLIVWLFVDSDMIMMYLLLGVLLGALVGGCAALAWIVRSRAVSA